ncbi:PREDICTED: uncharacterized protein LOC105151501 [Acromyrmex echinatior]|uniref:uncharacterized protein LOC105151501 n=1 Tax=Acromyrmex echinatior TaxID=103372 RepID=UPI000581086E|nr:PREDICTED: uncharacterized protein LOC105151501 [Acromyrmex echinatior]
MNSIYEYERPMIIILCIYRIHNAILLHKMFQFMKDRESDSDPIKRGLRDRRTLYSRDISAVYSSVDSLSIRLTNRFHFFRSRAIKLRLFLFGLVSTEGLNRIRM